QRVVQSVADVQRAGDVGRRHDDRPRLAVIAIRPEESFRLPVRVPAILDRLGFEGLGKLTHAEARLAMPRCSINLARAWPVRGAAAGEAERARLRLTHVSDI